MICPAQLETLGYHLRHYIWLLDLTDEYARSIVISNVPCKPDSACPFGKPVWMNLACRPLRSEATTPTRFSARRSSRSLFCSMEYPIDRLDGELFGIVFVTHPFEEFFVLRMTRIL